MIKDNEIFTADIGRALEALVRRARERVWLVSPFITGEAVRRILEECTLAHDRRLICRMNDADILSGVIDPRAVAQLLDAGFKVKFHDARLHAKLWITELETIVGSANLTGLALSTDLEAVIRMNGSTNAQGWFEELWDRLESPQMGATELRALAHRLDVHPARARLNPDLRKLNDYGTSPRTRKNTKSFVHVGRTPGETWFKLGGLAEERFPTTHDLLEQARLDGGLTWGPRNGTPNIKADDVIILAFMATNEHGEDDRVIYGRAVVDKDHDCGQDDLTREVLANIEALDPHDTEALREDIKRWPHITWVRDVQVVKGTAADGVWVSGLTGTDDALRNIRKQRTPFRLTDEELELAADALEERFRAVGVHHIERPIHVWWNQFIANPQQQVIREY